MVVPNGERVAILDEHWAHACAVAQREDLRRLRIICEIRVARHQGAFLQRVGRARRTTAVHRVDLGYAGEEGCVGS